MILHKARRAACLLAIAAILPAPVAAAPAADDGRTRGPLAQLRQRARDQGTVGVLVHLRVPGLAARTRASIEARDPRAAAAADRDLSTAIGRQVAAVRSLLATAPHTVYRGYDSVPFVAMQVSAAALDALAASPVVLGVSEDRPAGPALDGTVPLLGAPVAWTAGLDGSGWYVAVLDTGIRDTHDFFSSTAIVQACFARGNDMNPIAGDCPNGQATDTTSPDAAQLHPSNFNFFDHGTNVAGVAVGNDPDPANVPRFGVARAAGLIAVQVYSRFENDSLCGVANDCVLSFESDQIAGLDYVFSQRTGLDIAAVNLSIGSGRFYDQVSCDAAHAGIEAAVANLRGAGIATVIAAGNNGFCDSLNGPGCVSSAIAVASTDDLDVEASASNFHPTMLELYAPGVSILTSLGTGDEDYASRGGTSLAAPHVAGVWALMKQSSPAATVDEVLATLLASGETGVTYRCGGGGPPRVRVDAALGLAGSQSIPTLAPLTAALMGLVLLLAGARLLRRRSAARG